MAAHFIYDSLIYINLIHLPDHIIIKFYVVADVLIKLIMKQIFCLTLSLLEGVKYISLRLFDFI